MSLAPSLRELRAVRWLLANRKRKRRRPHGYALTLNDLRQPAAERCSAAEIAASQRRIAADLGICPPYESAALFPPERTEAEFQQIVARIRHENGSAN